MARAQKEFQELAMSVDGSTVIFRKNVPLFVERSRESVEAELSWAKRALRTRIEYLRSQPAL